MRRLVRRTSNVLIGRRLKAAGDIFIGQGAEFYGRPIVSMAADSKISLGSNVVLASRSAKTALGVNHPVIMRTLLPGASITIGDDVGVSGGSICSAVSVTLGDRVLLGANVTIADTDFHALHAEGRRYAGIPEPTAEDAIVIGNDVFIGEGCVILKGVTIGDNAVVGARTVVTTSIPRGATAVGGRMRVVE